MKRVLNIWGVMLLSIFFLFSCGKEKANNSGGSGSSPALQPPIISVSTPPTGWYASNFSIPYSVSSSNPGDLIALKINGVLTIANPYVINNLTTNTTLVFEASGLGGVTTKTVDVRVYSQDTTRLVYTAPGTEGKWKWSRGEVHWPDSSVTQMAPIDQTFKLFINGDCTFFPFGLPPLTGGKWTFVNGVITIGGLPRNILLLNDTLFMQSYVNNVHQLVIEWFEKY